MMEENWPTMVGGQGYLGNPGLDFLEPLDKREPRPYYV